MMKQYALIAVFLGLFTMLNCVDTIQWSSPAFIAGSAGALNAAVAMDAQGNALVSWQASTASNPVVRIVYYTAAEQSWSPIKELGAAYSKSYLYVSMSLDGNGIIAWIDDQQVVQTVNYAQENWQTWQPVLVSQSLPSDKATDLFMPQTIYEKRISCLGKFFGCLCCFI